MCGQVKITNIDNCAITYKIKTTAPEKFRVRPSTGILKEGASTIIVVIYNQGNSAASINRDKFLVMATTLSDGQVNDSQHLTEFWKNISSTTGTVEQHRLRCVLGDQTDEMLFNNTNGKMYETFESSGSGDHRFNAQLSHNLQAIKDNLQELKSQQRSMQKLQVIAMILFILLSITVIYILKVEIQSSGSNYCLRN